MYTICKVLLVLVPAAMTTNTDLINGQHNTVLQSDNTLVTKVNNGVLLSTSNTVLLPLWVGNSICPLSGPLLHHHLHATTTTNSSFFSKSQKYILGKIATPLFIFVCLVLICSKYWHMKMKTTLMGSSYRIRTSIHPHLSATTFYQRPCGGGYNLVEGRFEAAFEIGVRDHEGVLSVARHEADLLWDPCIKL